MKKFKFNKPLVESPYAPENTNVLWVDVIESTKKLNNIKEFVQGKWTDVLQLIPQKNNELFYTSVTNKKIDIINIEKFEEAFYARVISHTYENGIGVIRFNRNIREIGDYAFSENWGNLKSIILPESVYKIGIWAFTGLDNLIEITLPQGLSTTNNQCFYQCDTLNKINYTGDLASWCGIDFKDSQCNPSYYTKNLYINNELITDANIADGVTEIKKYTFINNTALQSITIPSTVVTIGEYAFYGCTQLHTITFLGYREDWEIVTKGTNWNKEVPVTIIHCLDGDITL